VIGWSDVLFEISKGAAAGKYSFEIPDFWYYWLNLNVLNTAIDSVRVIVICIINIFVLTSCCIYFSVLCCKHV